MNTHDRFTEEALKAQDDKKVPVTLQPGGPVIGEATLKYNSEAGALEAQFQVDDPEVTDFLLRSVRSTIFKQER